MEQPITEAHSIPVLTTLFVKDLAPRLAADRRPASSSNKTTAAGSGGAVRRRFSIAGKLINDLARLIPNDDGRSGFAGTAIFQKIINYRTGGPNGRSSLGNTAPVVTAEIWRR